MGVRNGERDRRDSDGSVRRMRGEAVVEQRWVKGCTVEVNCAGGSTVNGEVKW